MKRRQLLQGAAAGAALGPWVHTLAQDRYAKYKGQTIVVNYPAHPHYDQAEKLFAEFTAETGIKVERDKMQYLRMKDKQVLEMGKRGNGDYDVVVYVVMWKTEYVKKDLLQPLDGYFANSALADPAWDQKDIIDRYWETNALVGGPKMYLPGPGARPYGIPFGAETGVLAYRNEVDLTSELVAKVREILVEEGDTVEKGQLLLRLDPETYRNAIDREQATRRQAVISIERRS